jgi:apolipoprotein N-acyltransferase
VTDVGGTLEAPVAEAEPASSGVRGERFDRIRNRSWRQRRGRVAVPALLAGVGLALSLPPWGFWILAGPAAGLLWWRLGGLRFRQRLLAGWVAGLGLFVTGLWWALSFNVYGGLILMAVQALALALAGAASPPGRGRTAALAGAMVLTEALRSIWPFGGLPLGGIALGQAGGPLAGAARLGGPLLLVGLVWLGGAGLGALAVLVGRLWHHGRSGRRRPRGWDALARHAGTAGAGPDTDAAPATHPVPAPAWAGPVKTSVAALAVVGALGVWGAVAPDGGGGTATIRVAAIQGGGARGLRKAEVSPASVFAAQRAATEEIPAVDGGTPPVLVVWPEDVVSLDVPLGQSSAEATLADTAEQLRATLTVGVTETVSSTSFRNEIVAFAPDGRLVARFEKVHRVPFGEYVPDRGFFSHLANLSAVPLDAVPGHGDGVLHTPAGALGTMVSYEVFFAARGRTATRAGAQLLIVPTNTASYPSSQVPTQEIAASRLQAIAEGRDLIQASPTGFSAVVDHRGRVLLRSSLGTRQVLVDDVRLRTGLTVYERFGDLPVLIGAAVLLVGGWVAAFTGAESSPTARRERRNRRMRATGPMTRLRNR